MISVTPEQRDRYSRQIVFHGLGAAGQERLLAATAAIAGCGALGSFEAGALARAGVGRLILIDRDYVERSNLQRQWLYDDADAAEGLPKAVAAARHLAAINPDVQTVIRVADLTPSNAEELLEGADLILDGTDNFETRYLINDYSVREEVPWIYGAAIGSYGISMPVVPGLTPCLKCVFPAPPSGTQPTCETEGVLNAITSLIASLEVADAIKILAGAELHPKLTTADLWTGQMRSIEPPKPDPQCPACARREFLHLEGGRRAPISLCGRNAVQIHDCERPIDLSELARRLAPLGEVRANEFALRFRIEPYEMTLFPDGRAIIKGTQDVGLARSLYARYVGA